MDANHNEKELERLLQKSLPSKLIPTNPLELVTVFELGDPPNNITIYSGLIPNSAVSEALSNDQWEIHLGWGRPEFEHDGNVVTRYQRISDHDGVEPLVHYREFHTSWKSMPELTEEFRLFHNLFQNDTGELWMVDHNYEEVMVGRVVAKKVEVRLDLIRLYLAVRGMHLAIYYASHQRSDVTLAELGFTEERREDQQDHDSCSHLVVEDGWDAATFSRRVGKILIPPYPQTHDAVRYFYDGPPKSFEDFIIGINDRGQEVRHTCNKGRLDNLFGANPGAPQYLTPVWFKAAVLDRYYNEPSRFSVLDGYIRCQGLWGHRIDNQNTEGIICALGDLGDLPPQEQAHWKAHNIPPKGGYSDTIKRRWFDAEFAPSDRIEDDFQNAYSQLADISRRMLGWHFLKPLHEDEQHLLSSIRTPTKNEQKEFDEIIGALVKTVVDSMDVKKIKKLIPPAYTTTLEKGSLTGSISVLNHFFVSHNVADADVHIETLRDLQDYRSKATAHRRGSDWNLALGKLNPGGGTLRETATFQIQKTVEFLNFLSGLVKDFKTTK
ncbi:MAG: hypothetical protein IPH49_08985 [Ignavibacteria bacterium]|nr:hypothetical protein [Ignavibacteria bacterium]